MIPDRKQSRKAARKAAADWWIRRRAGPLTPAEQAEFDAWRASPVNAAAYANISRMCEHLAQVPAPALAERRHLAGRRFWPALAAPLAAASLALFLCFDDLSVFLRSDYSTGTGMTRSVTLEDGSRIELNAQSAVAVRSGPAQRLVVLLRGEAWFDVAEDPSRPFAVEAAGGVITALGTSFDIALRQGGALVTVTKHRAAISSGGQDVTVEEGQQSGFAKNAPPEPPAPVNTAWATAWRRGKLIVENEPLASVLAALGRRRHGLVVCLTRAVCAKRVTGVFGLGDPLESLAEIETSLGLRATSFTRYLVVLHE